MSNNDMQLFGGDWTDRKLDILAAYLHSYNTALKNQPFTRVYIDAFAGTGYRQNSSNEENYLFPEFEEIETQKFLKGSAKLALEVTPAFDRYVFIESDAQKVAELERLKQEHPDKAGAVNVIQDDANMFVQKYCESMPHSERAVVFLDPFATQVQWETIEAIAGTKAIDVWILFPLMAVNRLLARDHEKAFQVPLDRIFGSQEWFENFYRTRISNDIFGKPLEEVEKACDFDHISDYYRKRLRKIFPGVAPQPCVLYNNRKTPLFHLFFAAGNPKGSTIAVRIANHLLENL